MRFERRDCGKDEACVDGRRVIQLGVECYRRHAALRMGYGRVGRKVCGTARHMEFRSSCLVPAAGADAERTPVLVMAGPRTKQRWVYAPNEARTTKGQHEREACVIGQVVDEANARDGWLPSGHAGSTIDLAAPPARSSALDPLRTLRVGAPMTQLVFPVYAWAPPLWHPPNPSWLYAP